MTKRNSKISWIKKCQKCKMKNNVIIKIITSKIEKTLVVIFLFATSVCFSQKTVIVKNITGVSYIAGDVSENQARQAAISDAKINALKSAGIEEHISTFQTLYSNQINSDFSQFFSSDIQSEMQGSVKLYTITSEKKQINKESNQIEYIVTIDAE